MRGRPPKWQDAIDPAWDYVNGGFQQENDAVPTVAGLAVAIGCGKETLVQRGYDNVKPSR
jgi:hypothetical protein